MSFTIIQGKEGSSPKKPLFLVTIVAPDGDTVYLTTAAYYGAPNIAYSGNTYLARILKNDLQAIQAMGPQGYDSVPGFSITLADGDKALWLNHCVPHGWRGSTISLTAILWDVVANAYSTDAIQWTFIGGNPEHDAKSGQTTLEAMAAVNFTRLKIPSVPLSYTCPWDFPGSLAQRTAALKDPTSPYYQCGYSADVSGGVGNLTSGVAYTSCDKTRSGGPPGVSGYDPSVGCMARLGNAAHTNVAPDGDITHDIAGNYTGRFGGITWIAPPQYSGRQYVTGQKTFGYNPQNTAIVGTYFPWVYGTQWVSGMVLAPAGDPNSLRSEVVLCFAPFGPITVWQLLVNGVIVPFGGGDVLFTWRFNSQAATPNNNSAGGRSGALCGDSYFSTPFFSGLSDPHGSLAVIEFVVPAELAAPGSVPSVQALITSGALLNCYPIASITGGVVTFAANVTNTACAGNPPFTVLIVGNSNAALNAAFTLTNWTYGPPGTITLNGTTASGTGGGVFFVHSPDLLDSSEYDISTQDSVQTGPAANPVWTCLDLLSWGNIAAAQIDPVSFYAAAMIAAIGVSYVGADGNTYSHAQYKTCLQLPGNARQTLASTLIGVRNAANLMIGPSITSGLIECYVKLTLHDQQPSAIPGSNDTTARASMPATSTSGVPSLSTPGYYAYSFDETNIEPGSFRVTTTRIAATPNTVAVSFQDEYNSYQTDTLEETDPDAYAYSGNQEVNVPIPLLGIANFDQASRIANTQLAEALYGNQRDDAGGTEFYEFTVNMRVIHLCGRLGYICGLTWQALGIGCTPGTIIPSVPQAIRILSLTPDTDGEHWKVKAAWHADVWYTYAYGQNPNAYQNNPLLAPQNRPPYPWQPGQTVWGSTDALFPSVLGFTFWVDLTQYPAQLLISGTVPDNAQPTGLPPIVPLQAGQASTGGSIKPGVYLFAFSSNAQSGPVSSIVLVQVQAGTNTNTITISGIQWKSGAAPSIQPFAGTAITNMRACASGSYTTSSPDSNGNPTTFVFTAITAQGAGLPDINFYEFLVEETTIIHGGVWGDTVTQVVGDSVEFSGAAMSWTVGQWDLFILSLYYRPNLAAGTPQPGLNQQVSTSYSGNLSFSSGTTFQAGDVVVMRAQATTYTASTIGCASFVNSYAPSGLTPSTGTPPAGPEVGNMIFIIAGTGKGTTPKTIVSNTSTVFTIKGTFDITPDATSVFIVIAPTVAYSYYTQNFQGTGVGVAQIANTPAITSEEQSLLVTVYTCDVNGNTFPFQYQPFREVYIPPQPPDPPIFLTYSATPQTLAPMSQIVSADATGGSFTIVLPPMVEWIGDTITIIRTDSTANTITWETTSPDVITSMGGATSGTLTSQGAGVEITAVSS